MSKPQPANHNIDVEGLLAKVSMNSAFLKLAKEDSELIQEMDQAIKVLYDQAKRREIVYLAIEHNCKYLASLADQAHSERVIAVKNADDNQTTNEELKKLNTDIDKELKVFKKDSAALAALKIQMNTVSLDLAQSKEKEEKIVADMKDCIHRLKKAESSLQGVTDARDEFKESSETLDVELKKYKIDLKEYKNKEQLASEANLELTNQNTKYRALYTEHEHNMATTHEEVSELKKQLTVFKSNNERVREENEAFQRQNDNLIAEIKELKTPDEEFQITQANKNAISDPELSPRTLEKKIIILKTEMAKEKAAFTKQEENRTQLLQFSKDANIRVKEDFELLEERFKRHSKANEALIGELRDEVKDIQQKTRTLQEFFDKYDEMLSTQRRDLTNQIIKINKTNEEQESALKKKLNNTQSELETLKGEFQVKMQQIKLTQMEVENQLIEFNEKKELQEMELSTLKKQLKLTTVKLKRSESKLSMRMDSTGDSARELLSPKKGQNQDIAEEDSVNESGTSGDINSRMDNKSPVPKDQTDDSFFNR